MSSTSPNHPTDDFHTRMEAYFDAHQARLQPQSPGEASRPTSPALIDKLLETVESKVPSSFGDVAPNTTPEQAETKQDNDVSKQAGGMGIDAIMMQAEDILQSPSHLVPLRASPRLDTPPPPRHAAAAPQRAPPPPTKPPPPPPTAPPPREAPTKDLLDVVNRLQQPSPWEQQCACPVQAAVTAEVACGVETVTRVLNKGNLHGFVFEDADVVPLPAASPTMQAPLKAVRTPLPNEPQCPADLL
jgi:hypothetical protein